jgi:hypothetical protein
VVIIAAVGGSIFSQRYVPLRHGNLCADKNAETHCAN